MILNTHNHPVLSNSTSGNDPPIFNGNSSDDQFLLQSHFENYWTLLTCKFCTHFCLNSEWDIIKQVLLSTSNLFYVMQWENCLFSPYQDCRDTLMLWVFLSACTVLSYSACFSAVDMRWSSNVQLTLTWDSVSNLYTQFKMNWCVLFIVILYHLGGTLAFVINKVILLFINKVLVWCKFLWLGAESQLLFDVANGVLNTEQELPRGYSSVAEPTNIITDGKLCDPNVQQYRYRWLNPPLYLIILFSQWIHSLFWISWGEILLLLALGIPIQSINWSPSCMAYWRTRWGVVIVNRGPLRSNNSPKAKGTRADTIIT